MKQLYKTYGHAKTNLEQFEKHPDSGKKYKGFQIPRWDELIDLVKQLHCLYKKSRFVGWDLTLTKNGWVLVEGNGKPNFDTIQIINYKTFGHGLRDELINVLGKYKNQQQDFYCWFFYTETYPLRILFSIHLFGLNLSIE